MGSKMEVCEGAKMEIYESTKIYIISPPNVITGGTEVLHQLCAKLKKYGYDAYMYYGIKEEPQIFQQYNLPVAIILPEICLFLLCEEDNVTKMIYWLSVDNFLGQLKVKITNYSRIIKEISNKGVNLDSYKGFFHLAQSEYAHQFLIKSGIDENKIFRLRDYINEKFTKMDVGYNSLGREDLVLYNPKKGIEFTNLLRHMAPHIDWVPIQNMTPEQVVQLMLRSKVYIDFGNHPGRDKIPREAAILGCCVITGIRGSARYFEDVSIDRQYKFLDIESNLPKIIEKITYCLNHYDEEIGNFNDYREIIKNDEIVFEQDLLDIFTKVVLN
jgi:hypothetical protein